MSIVAGRPPSLSSKSISEIVCKYFNFNYVVQNSVKALPAYDDRNYYFRGQNLISCEKCSDFILKVSNPYHTSFEMTCGLNAVMKHVSSSSLPFLTPSPLHSTSGSDSVVLSLSELTNAESCTRQVPENGTGSEEMKYFARVLTFIPGELFDEVDKKFLTPNLLNAVGEMLGNVDKELRVRCVCVSYILLLLHDCRKIFQMKFLSQESILGILRKSRV